jgi:hypothetical protein
MIRIRSLRDGFRRAGLAHSVAPTEYQDDHFTADELEQLLFEPMLAVEVLPNDAGEFTPQELRQLIADWRDEVGNDDEVTHADLSALALDSAGKSGETDEAVGKGKSGSGKNKKQTQAKPEADGKITGLRITSSVDGLQCAGREWAGVTDVPVIDLTDEQIKQIMEEPGLSVQDVLIAAAEVDQVE